MEEKLFWIGILMGAHLFVSHQLREKGKFKAHTRFTRVWHAVFAALVSFVGAVLITVSLDNRRGDVVTSVLHDHFRDTAAMVGPSGEDEIARRLFPDQEAFKREERRRYRDTAGPRSSTFRHRGSSVSSSARPRW